MFGKPKREVNELTVLAELIKKMEAKGDNPEYLPRNIELIGKIIVILQDFKDDMLERMGKS